MNIDRYNELRNKYIASKKEVQAEIVTKVAAVDVKFAGKKIKMVLAHAYITVSLYMKPSHVGKTLAFRAAWILLTSNKAAILCGTTLPKLLTDILNHIIPYINLVITTCVSILSQLPAKSELPKLLIDILNTAAKYIQPVLTTIISILSKLAKV